MPAMHQLGGFARLLYCRVRGVGFNRCYCRRSLMLRRRVKRGGHLNDSLCGFTDFIEHKSAPYFGSTTCAGPSISIVFVLRRPLRSGFNDNRRRDLCQEAVGKLEARKSGLWQRQPAPPSGCCGAVFLQRVEDLFREDDSISASNVGTRSTVRRPIFFFATRRSLISL
jgi:hypothetical protein